MELGNVNVQQRLDSMDIFIDDSMYVVDDRHIWLFQPDPPPVIPAAP